MDTKKEFIDTFVKIERQDNGEFGFYPFSMVVKTKENKMELMSLILGGDIKAVYKTFITKAKEFPKKMFLAVDFPALPGAKLDTVVVYDYDSIEDIKISIVPYDIKTGEVFPELLASDLITLYEKELAKAINIFY